MTNEFKKVINAILDNNLVLVVKLRQVENKDKSSVEQTEKIIMEIIKKLRNKIRDGEELEKADGLFLTLMVNNSLLSLKTQQKAVNNAIKIHEEYFIKPLSELMNMSENEAKNYMAEIFQNQIKF